MQFLLATLNSKYIHTNLAIRIFYQLNKNKENIHWKEFTINEDADGIVSYCTAYDVIAFSCYIWNITQTLAVAKKIKTKNPSIKILLGGPEVSYEYQNVIALPYIDFIIQGEGEIPLQAFFQSYPNVEEVPALIYKTDDNKIIENKVAAQIPLDALAEIMPYSDDDKESLKTKVLYIETSRGCPYKCEFCLASLDNKVRYFPNASIKRNLLYLMQHGRVIKFLDRTFNLKKDFTIDIFQFILDNHTGNNIFQFEITADIIHPDIVQFIHDYVPKGLFRFEIGIQTVNQKANLAVSRKQNFEKTKSIIKTLENKIELHLDLIVGLALDYYDDIKYSFEEVFKLFAPELQLGFLKFLKGTPVRDKHQQHGFVFDPNPPYQIIESNYLSKTELKKIVLLEHALEIYWNKGRAINTLKYIALHYSIFDFLQGLGTYFSCVSNLHRYTLKDVYEIIYQFANSNYTDDIIVKEMIAIDYYLHHKVRPQQLIIQDLPKNEKLKILQENKLNTQNFSYIILPIHFDFNIFEEKAIIDKKSATIIFQYSGTASPIIFLENNQYMHHV